MIYREVWVDTPAPGGWVCGTCERPVESEPCPEHAEPLAIVEDLEDWQP